MLKKNLSTILFLFCLFTFSQSASAFKMKGPKDSFLNIKGYMQGWSLLSTTAAKDKDGKPAFGGQFYFRRMRLLFGGRITKKIHFFYGTIQANMGKNGNYSPAWTTADSWISFDIDKSLKIDMGILMIPFIHNFRQGGATFHNIDAHYAIRKLPAGSHFLGRDNGIGIRGVLLGKSLSYFFHFTSGNMMKGGAARITARLVYNLFQPETKFFYAGTYLGKKKVVSFGVAVDTLPLYGGRDKDGKKTTYYAIGADLFVDLPMGKNGFTTQVNFAMYKNSISKCVVDPKTGLNKCLPFNGMGLLAELGYRIKKISIVAGFDWLMPDGADFTKQYLAILGGLNYWLVGHKMNFKLQYSLVKAAGKSFDKASHTVLLQTQILFN